MGPAAELEGELDHAQRFMLDVETEPGSGLAGVKRVNNNNEVFQDLRSYW